MLYRVIDASDLPALVEGFMESYEVVAPVAHDGKYIFDTVHNPNDIVLDYVQTVSSPKKYLLPSKDTLFKFDLEANDVTDFEVDIKPRVIFGVHACDINAFNRMDLVLREGRYPDPYYIARREKTLIVGINCTPGENCFCNLWGSDEARFGYDLFLVDIGDKYIVSIASNEAATILEQYCNVHEASDEDRIAFREETRRRERAFNPDIPDVQEVAMLMDAFRSDPFWDEFGGRCLSCTACAAVCPSCFCFDIQDQVNPDGKTGDRLRLWDACTSPSFATVTGGHNFRAKPRNRVRHRMYHKLNGFQANYDRMLCVGCGRCVTACKANINPIEVLKFFKEKGADNGDE